MKIRDKARKFSASDISSAKRTDVPATCGSLEGFMNEISRSSDVRRYTNVTEPSSFTRNPEHVAARC